MVLVDPLFAPGDLSEAKRARCPMRNTLLGAAWMSLVLVELVASSEGIGFMVVWGRQLFQLDLVLVAIIVIGAVGLTLDGLLRAVEWRLRRWQGAAA